MHRSLAKPSPASPARPGLLQRLPENAEVEIAKTVPVVGEGSARGLLAAFAPANAKRERAPACATVLWLWEGPSPTPACYPQPLPPNASGKAGNSQGRRQPRGLWRGLGTWPGGLEPDGGQSVGGSGPRRGSPGVGWMLLLLCAGMLRWAGMLGETGMLWQPRVRRGGGGEGGLGGGGCGAGRAAERSHHDISAARPRGSGRGVGAGAAAAERSGARPRACSRSPSMTASATSR